MSTPAGWYDDGSGRQRWWDGEQWTEHFAPAQDAKTDAAAQTPSEASESAQDDLDATVRREDVSAPQTDAAAASDAYAPPVADATPAEPAPYAPPTASAPYAEANAGAAQPGAAQPGAQDYPGGQQAPYAAAPYGTAPYQAPGYAAAAPAPAGPAKPPVLGFVGLGLAVVGTILACIPPFLAGFGYLLLFAAFVVSLIAIFQKAKKWPAIVGLALSIVGGILGGVMSFLFFVNMANDIASDLPSDFPTEITSDAPVDEAAGRPSPEEITAGYLAIMSGETGVEEFTEPEVAACIGQYYYDSDLSDEVLQHIAGGEDIFGEGAEEVQQVTAEAATQCLQP